MACLQPLFNEKQLENTGWIFGNRIIIVIHPNENVNQMYAPILWKLNMKFYVIVYDLSAN